MNVVLRPCAGAGLRPGTEAAAGLAVADPGGPSVVVVDEGAAKTLNTTTMRKHIYAVAFGQQGLMAGLGLEGSKIRRIYPKP